MEKINQLKQGQKGITPIVAAFLVEATIICLMRNGHQSGVQLKVEGDYEMVFELYWSDEMTEQMQKSWNDQREVTEYGATAIAALLLQKLTTYEILGRAEQEEGIDYYIGNNRRNRNHRFTEWRNGFGRYSLGSVNQLSYLQIQKITSSANP